MSSSAHGSALRVRCANACCASWRDVPRQSRLRACEHGAIAQTLENLMTFPWIRERVERSELELHGWYFDIDAGDLLGYSAETKSFASASAFR